MVTSTPAKPKRIVIMEFSDPVYSSSGKVFRAFEKEGAPLYMGAETRETLVQRVRESYPDAVIEEQV